MPAWLQKGHLDRVAEVLQRHDSLVSFTLCICTFKAQASWEYLKEKAP